MFDIGFFELVLVGVVALLVVGPERLPDAVRTTARWWSNIKRVLHNARDELEKEVGADDIRRELHNQRILQELEESRQEMENSMRDIERDVRSERSSRQDTSAEAQDYLPEEDESAGQAQDPEYPEHWHDHGDPELNPGHPDHGAEEDSPTRQKPQKNDSQS